MLKSLQWIAVLTVALTAVTSKAILAAPVEKKPQAKEVIPEELQFGAEVPLCYIRTADGRALDLTNLCKERPEAANISAVPSTPQPTYDNSAIKKFDDELYGVDN